MSGPPAPTIDLVVMHNISLPPGEYGGDAIERLFTNRLDPDAHPYFAKLRELQVSAHFLIRRDGECVQFVPFERRAWHAGASNWRGRERCNDFSIGIELEGSDESPFEATQYRRLPTLSQSSEAATASRDIAGAQRNGARPQDRSRARTSTGRALPLPASRRCN